MDNGPGFDVLLKQVFLEQMAILPAGILFVSHAASFVRNFLVQGERNRASVRDLIEAPFSRVVLMHLTIVFGAALLLASKNPVAGVLMLVVLKIAMDIQAHVRERRRYAASSP